VSKIFKIALCWEMLFFFFESFVSGLVLGRVFWHESLRFETISKHVVMWCSIGKLSGIEECWNWKQFTIVFIIKVRNSCKFQFLFEDNKNDLKLKLRHGMHQPIIIALQMVILSYQRHASAFQQITLLIDFS
jgi:hypothetical protein